VNAVELLANHKLKRTSCRESLLDLFLKTEEALSENDLRDKISGHYDRTTFYRSFKTLVEADIIHKVVVDNQIVKYALKASENRSCEHAHFYCSECHMVKCLEAIPAFELKLPDGFIENETEILIKGTCSECQKSNSNAP
jgi:Fur family transcriptional regulator, ferric uptake regulator